MARELDSGMLQRLQRQYEEMSDGELQRLAAAPQDLTDFAVEVLRGEMTRRGLKPEAAVAQAGPFSVGHGEPPPEPRFGTKLPDGSVVLMRFYDALAVGEACDHLEGEGIEVGVRDVSEKSSGGGSFYGGPAVALEVIVPGWDRARSVEILREKMGLFPLQEVEEADELVDDGTVAVVGYFGRREDAEDVARILEQGRIWHRIAVNEEGAVEDENAFSLEVREVDLVGAGELVEKAMGLPGGVKGERSVVSGKWSKGGSKCKCGGSSLRSE